MYRENNIKCGKSYLLTVVLMKKLKQARRATKAGNTWDYNYLKPLNRKIYKTKLAGCRSKCKQWRSFPSTFYLFPKFPVLLL